MYCTTSGRFGSQGFLFVSAHISCFTAFWQRPQMAPRPCVLSQVSKSKWFGQAHIVDHDPSVRPFASHFASQTSRNSPQGMWHGDMWHETDRLQLIYDNLNGQKGWFGINTIESTSACSMFMRFLNKVHARPPTEWCPTQLRGCFTEFTTQFPSRNCIKDFLFWIFNCFQHNLSGNISKSHDETIRGTSGATRLAFSDTAAARIMV